MIKFLNINSSGTCVVTYWIYYYYSVNYNDIIIINNLIKMRFYPPNVLIKFNIVL